MYTVLTGSGRCLIKKKWAGSIVETADGDVAALLYSIPSYSHLTPTSSDRKMKTALQICQFANQVSYCYSSCLAVATVASVFSEITK
jgi:hypothetical protein